MLPKFIVVRWTIVWLADFLRREILTHVCSSENYSFFLRKFLMEHLQSASSEYGAS